VAEFAALHFECRCLGEIAAPNLDLGDLLVARHALRACSDGSPNLLDLNVGGLGVRHDHGAHPLAAPAPGEPEDHQVPHAGKVAIAKLHLLRIDVLAGVADDDVLRAAGDIEV